MMNCRAHDLLWVRRDRLRSAGPDTALPDWVVSGVGPVVVRRAPAEPGLVPVGVRGRNKSERQAAFAPLDSVVDYLDPYTLTSGQPWRQHPDHDMHPVLVTLGRLAPMLDHQGLNWGITGSLGYELATGEPQLTASSDLDLVIDAPQSVSRLQAAQLLRYLDDTECRVDIQLETPLGAIALAEWASNTSRVLLKTCDGPRLTATPWYLEPVQREKREGVMPC